MKFGLGLPELSHIEALNELETFTTVDGIQGVVARVPLVDLESRDKESNYSQVNELIKTLSEDVVSRWTLRARHKNRFIPGDSKRSSSLAEIGFLEKELLLSLEWKKSSLVKNLFKKASVSSVKMPHQLLATLGCTFLSREELLNEFEHPLAEMKSTDALDIGTHLLGVIRLQSLGVEDINWQTLAGIQDQIPTPFEIVCSIKKTSQTQTDFLLRSKINQNQFFVDATTGDKQQAAEQVLRDVSLNGNHLYEMEWLLVLTRLDESTLRSDLSVAQKVIRTLGTPYIESAGAAQSYISSRIGVEPHVTLKEVDPTVLYFLPITTYGEERITSRAEVASCLLHRQDGSAHELNLFNSKYLAFNTLITGKTGSGKSVFGNALSGCVLHSPKIHIVKVDVGGSYKRECAINGGSEINFHLDKPSGIDPFSEIKKQKATNEEITVIAELLCVLALEEGEAFVSKSIRSDYEKGVRDYFSLNQEKRSLSDFISKSKNLHRQNILERWSKGGVFENAIHPGESKETNRYTYYNFENLNGASNKDYASGVMAAVIAAVNLRVIALSSPDARSAGSQFIFFCDETKFFIEKNAAFFLLTTANFRKFGHAVVLVGQNIENFILKTADGEDRGILLNSPTRIFFESEAQESFYRQEFGFKDREISILKKNPYRGSAFRQFILQDDLGTRLCRLYLTPKDYWSSTSTRQEVDQLDSLKSAVPWLSDNQLISVMAMKEVQ